jgi:tetratricopeptide (TPR) repeat protein
MNRPDHLGALGGMRLTRTARACVLVLSVPLALAVFPAHGQTPQTEAASPGDPPAGSTTTEPAESVEAEKVRVRILARLSRVEEALAGYRALLARHGDNRGLREDYAEFLVDAGLLDQAAPVIDRYLADDPASARLRRLRARVDLARSAPAEAARRLDALVREQPQDAGLTAELAAAERAAGRWNRALDLYGGLLDRDPDNRDLLTAYREIVQAHAPRFELSHYTLLQRAATQHVEEAAWRGWLADQWWLRAGTRYGSYHQDSIPGQSSFSAEVWTALAALGFQPIPALSLWTGLEEARRNEDSYRTTFRLGGTYDDGRATIATLDSAVRELLTNPVAALPRNGSTDRVTIDVARRILNPIVLALHYDFRHYRASGEELGDRWEAAARVELEVVKTRPVQVTLIPQLFFAQYAPVAESPLRDEIAFLRREDIIAIGILVGWDVTPAVRVQIGSVGRRDLFRAITSWEVTGETRWRIRPWLEGRVLYTRNTESTTVGGREESFLGRLDILY